MRPGARGRELGHRLRVDGAGAGPSRRRGRSGPPGRGLARGLGCGAHGRMLGAPPEPATATARGCLGPQITCTRSRAYAGLGTSSGRGSSWPLARSCRRCPASRPATWDWWCLSSGSGWWCWAPEQGPDLHLTPLGPPVKQSATGARITRIRESQGGPVDPPYLDHHAYLPPAPAHDWQKFGARITLIRHDQGGPVNFLPHHRPADTDADTPQPASTWKAQRSPFTVHPF